MKRFRWGGSPRFGDLQRLSPISREFGLDRGLPIDRFYMERFLAAHAHHIRGAVLEIGEPTYADAILDRIVHNAHRLELDGETIRKNRARAGKKE